MIDEESLLLLTKEEIKELITKVGPRMKLLKNLEELKNGRVTDTVI